MTSEAGSPAWTGARALIADDNEINNDHSNNNYTIADNDSII